MRSAARNSALRHWRDFGPMLFAWLIVVSMGVGVSHAQDGVPAEPGDELIVEFKGKKKRAKVQKILVHLKFFTPRGPRANRLKFKKQERRRWIRQAKWWVKKTNKFCDIKKIAGVKDDGRDRSTLPEEGTHFVENSDLLTSSDPDEGRFFAGDAELVRRIGTNTSTRFFNIGIFRTVRTASQFADSAGSVPGKYIAPNVMAAKTSMEIDDRRHELGHLMGLKHSDGGLMHKNDPSKGASTKSSPWYGDQRGGIDTFLKSWCSKIAAHLDL